MPKQAKPSAKKPLPRKDKIVLGLTQVLQHLRTVDSTITGVAVVNTDGQVVAAHLPKQAQKSRVGSIAATMLSIGQQTVAEFEQGGLERVFIESENGFTLITTASPDTILVVLARPDAKLGSLFLQTSRAVEEIRGLFVTAQPILPQVGTGNAFGRYAQAEPRDSHPVTFEPAGGEQLPSKFACKRIALELTGIKT